jgi:hypothetical protein
MESLLLELNMDAREFEVAVGPAPPADPDYQDNFVSRETQINQIIAAKRCKRLELGLSLRIATLADDLSCLRGPRRVFSSRSKTIAVVLSSGLTLSLRVARRSTWAEVALQLFNLCIAALGTAAAQDYRMVALHRLFTDVFALEFAKIL